MYETRIIRSKKSSNAAATTYWLLHVWMFGGNLGNSCLCLWPVTVFVLQILVFNEYYNVRNFCVAMLVMWECHGEGNIYSVSVQFLVMIIEVWSISVNRVMIEFCFVTKYLIKCALENWKMFHSVSNIKRLYFCEEDRRILGSSPNLRCFYILLWKNP